MVAGPAALLPWEAGVHAFGFPVVNMVGSPGQEEERERYN